VRTVVWQHCFLDGGGHQAVAGHSNIISENADLLEEVKRRIFPGLNAGASTPRS